MKPVFRRCRAVALAAFVLASAGQAAAAAEGEREALLQRAEAALARGETTRAAETFERAAAMAHAPDTEMGIVRTAMQQGRYAQALAFCAHTAGAHLESAAAGALYAWLLRIGGHIESADQVLAATLARAPDDAVAQAVRAAFATPSPRAEGVLLAKPHRMAPEARSDASAEAGVPRAAMVLSSGVLVERGTQAIVPLAALARASGTRVWLRNGLGELAAGTLDDGDASLAAAGLARVRLGRALPFEAGDEATHEVVPAGRAAFAIDYPVEHAPDAAAGSGAAPAWPWLHPGFIGSTARDGTRRLGVALAGGAQGGPVLDAQGRLAGIALSLGGGPAFVPASAWQPGLLAGVAAAARAATADEAYERALRVALQVIAVPR